MRVSLVITFFCFSNFLFSQTKIDEALFPLKSLNDYIIVFHNQYDVNTKSVKGKANKALQTYSLLQKNSTIQSNTIAYLKSNNIFFEKFSVVNGIRVKSNEAILLELAKRKEIVKILKNINIALDKPVEESNISSRSVTPEWGILKIQADSVWRLGYEGQGVIVGGQDTGYDWAVSPLKSKYRGFVNDTFADHSYNWHDAIKDKSPLSKDSLNPCGFNLKSPCDDNNHGTHTMGTMVGQDTSNSIGVAPKAQWMACRNMERGNGQLSTYLECFEWFLAPTDIEGKNPDVNKAPHVINNSWYCSPEEGCNTSNWEALNVAVQNLKSAGVVVVVSAGNSGPNCNTISGPPAFFSPSFTVGATAINDTIANFSSRGAVSVDSSYRLKPDVSAPGRNVRSVIRGGSFAAFSGTSMAGPHTAGLVALILSANKELEGEVDVIEDIIKQTAVPRFTEQECDSIAGQSYPNATYGYGRINALKAVELALKTIVSSTNETEKNQAWKLFPNPTNSKLSIENIDKNYTSNYTVKLFSKTGSLLSTYNLQGTSNIDLTALPSDLYILQIISNGGVFVSKVYKD